MKTSEVVVIEMGTTIHEIGHVLGAGTRAWQAGPRSVCAKLNQQYYQYKG